MVGALLVILGVWGTPSQAADTPGPDWHTTVRQFAMEHFKQPAWGYSHSVRDYALARTLAAADHVTLDDDVLFAASFLHDIAAFKPWEDEKRDHSDVGADVLPTILKDTGFPMAKIDAVRSAIRTHMYYRDPVGPEARYLHDADASSGTAEVFARFAARNGQSIDLVTSRSATGASRRSSAPIPASPPVRYRDSPRAPAARCARGHSAAANPRLR
jgi:uncharacterized protein